MAAGEGRIYEDDWAANLDEIERASQVLFIAESAEGQGMMDSLESSGRIVITVSDHIQGPGWWYVDGQTWVDNLARNENQIFETATGTPVNQYLDGEWNPPPATDDMWPEFGYYFFGALTGETIHDNNEEGVSIARADLNHNGRVSIWEAWQYARDHQSRIPTIYDPDTQRHVLLTPRLDDDGQNGDEAPTTLDGLLSQTAYF
jgi:hypothetical protein